MPLFCQVSFSYCITDSWRLDANTKNCMSLALLEAEILQFLYFGQLHGNNIKGNNKTVAIHRKIVIVSNHIDFQCYFYFSWCHCDTLLFVSLICSSLVSFEGGGALAQRSKRSWDRCHRKVSMTRSVCISW